LVIIRPQHTCGGEPPPAAERRRFLWADEKALAVAHTQLCGARADRGET
jgi:hypothetical protein